MKHPYTGWIITGDFNTFPDRLMGTIIPLKQTVKAATRGSAILDKIYTNLEKQYLVPATLPVIGKGDHNPVEYLPCPCYKPNKGKAGWKNICRFGTNEKTSFAASI